MITEQIRKQLSSKIESLDESQLKIVSDFIDKLQSAEASELDLKQYLDEVIKERQNVLQKLAQ